MLRAHLRNGALRPHYYYHYYFERGSVTETVTC